MSVFKHLPSTTIYFAHALDTPIYNEEGLKMGVLCDFFVDYEEVYPVVLAIQYMKSGQFFYINWEDIKYFSYKKIVVLSKSNIRRSRTYPKVTSHKVITSLLANQFKGDTVEYPPIGKIILDRQIVDTAGKKVVRVNDIQFLKVGTNLRVTHAAIGFRSIIRRIGFEKGIDFLVKMYSPKAKYLTSDVIINWKYVHAIPDKSIQKNVQLTLTDEIIKNMHPADLADILEELDGHGRDLIFSNLGPEQAAKTLSEVDPEMQLRFIKNETPEEAAKILENMGTDEAADILDDLSDEMADRIISNFSDDEIQEELHELLEYDEECAGGLMSTEVFQVSPYAKKSTILKLIQEEHEDIESIYDIYVVDAEGKLLGTCSLKRLLIQEHDIEIKDIMNSNDIKHLYPNLKWKEVATYMSKYNLINVPIVEKATNELLGIISVDDILPWLLDER